MGTLALILVPAVLFAAVVWLVLAIREGGGAVAGRRGWERVAGPWWGSPAVWVGVCAVLIVLGVLVAPRLLGFTFLFLPFLWMGRMRRRR